MAELGDDFIPPLVLVPTPLSWERDVSDAYIRLVKCVILPSKRRVSLTPRRKPLLRFHTPFCHTFLSMSDLLPFQRSLLEKIHDPATSELILLARGLGLRRIVCHLLQIYDARANLVLLVNASPEDESAIGEELGILGCRKPGLRIVGFEKGKKERCVRYLSIRLTTISLTVSRQDLYKGGGLLSITSQIFTVDMLLSDIPTKMITGIIVLHAEK